MKIGCVWVCGCDGVKLWFFREVVNNWCGFRRRIRIFVECDWRLNFFICFWWCLLLFCCWICCILGCWFVWGWWSSCWVRVRETWRWRRRSGRRVTTRIVSFELFFCLECILLFCFECFCWIFWIYLLNCLIWMFDFVWNVVRDFRRVRRRKYFSGDSKNFLLVGWCGLFVIMVWFYCF